MGRYKTVLTADKDARELPYTVDLAIPGDGLGKRMDVIANWLNTNAKARWAEHGKMINYKHIARYYFESPLDAQTFEAWLETPESHVPA